MMVFRDSADKGDAAATIVLGVVGRGKGMETEFFLTTTTKGLFAR
jgi:hypothetical protein